MTSVSCNQIKCNICSMFSCDESPISSYTSNVIKLGPQSSEMIFFYFSLNNRPAESSDRQWHDGYVSYHSTADCSSSSRLCELQSAIFAWSTAAIFLLRHVVWHCPCSWRGWQCTHWTLSDRSVTMLILGQLATIKINIICRSPPKSCPRLEQVNYCCSLHVVGGRQWQP